MVENAYIELPFGIFREDAIIGIALVLDEIDNGIIARNQILPAIRVYMINGSSLDYTFTSYEDRNDAYDECVKILTTNN